MMKACYIDCLILTMKTVQMVEDICAKSDASGIVSPIVTGHPTGHELKDRGTASSLQINIYASYPQRLFFGGRELRDYLLT